MVLANALPPYHCSTLVTTTLCNQSHPAWPDWHWPDWHWSLHYKTYDVRHCLLVLLGPMTTGPTLSHLQGLRPLVRPQCPERSTPWHSRVYSIWGLSNLLFFPGLPVFSVLASQETVALPGNSLETVPAGPFCTAIATVASACCAAPAYRSQCLLGSSMLILWVLSIQSLCVSRLRLSLSLMYRAGVSNIMPGGKNQPGKFPVWPTAHLS